MEFANMFIKLSILEHQATRWAFVLPRLHVLLPHVVSHVLTQMDGLRAKEANISVVALFHICCHQRLEVVISSRI